MFSKGQDISQFFSDSWFVQTQKKEEEPKIQQQQPEIMEEEGSNENQQRTSEKEAIGELGQKKNNELNNYWIADFFSKNIALGQEYTSNDLVSLIKNKTNFNVTNHSLHRRVTDCLNWLNLTGKFYYHERKVSVFPPIHQFVQKKMSYPSSLMVKKTCLSNKMNTVMILGENKKEVSRSKLVYFKTGGRKGAITEAALRKLSQRLKRSSIQEIL